MVYNAAFVKLLPRIATVATRTVTPKELAQLAEAMGCHTQADLAAALGITQARVSQILSGKYPIKPGTLLNLIHQLQLQHPPGRKARR
jgi:transcriptional regulator with XRE-family HTH domain